MQRPTTFPHSYVAMQNTPYLLQDGSAQEHPLMGGVLGKGKTVWAEKLEPQRPAKANVFLEEVGVVCLDARSLIPADESKDT